MERKGKWGQSGVRAKTHNFERRCAGPRRVLERVGAVTHRLLVRVVLVVVGEQVDAEADAPGHGEEGDAPPLLHVSCAGGGRGGRVRSVVGRAVYLWASSQRGAKKHRRGVLGFPRATGDGDGIVQSATAASRIAASTTRTKSRGTRASTPGPSARD